MYRLREFNCTECDKYTEELIDTNAADDQKTMTCPECGAVMIEKPWKNNVSRYRFRDLKGN
jgi:uncharacterized Zn finger protein